MATPETIAPGPDPHLVHTHTLKSGALHTFDTIIMALAGSAPAHSLAATTPILVAAAGLYGPAALLWCAIPMLGIAVAFNYLGKLDVHAGATYSWVARSLHPVMGFFAGWSLVVSATIFMVAGSLPAGRTRSPCSRTPRRTTPGPRSGSVLSSSSSWPPWCCAG